MSAYQRTKGQQGEREVAQILCSALGLPVSRNWKEQFFGGAFELVGIPGWAVEVKRARSAQLQAWWEQTIQQAEKAKLKPALLYRIDGYGRGLEPDEKWRAVVPLNTFTDAGAKPFPVEMSLRAWIYLLVKAHGLSGLVNDSVPF